MVVLWLKLWEIYGLAKIIDENSVFFHQKISSNGLCVFLDKMQDGTLYGVDDSISIKV